MGHKYGAAAAMAVLATLGCQESGAPQGRVVLELQVVDEAARPERALLTWSGPEAIAVQALVPARGHLAPSGAVLGTVVIDLVEVPGERRAHFVGLRGETPLSTATVAGIDWRRGGTQRIPVLFVRALPDAAAPSVDTRDAGPDGAPPDAGGPPDGGAPPEVQADGAAVDTADGAAVDAADGALAPDLRADLSPDTTPDARDPGPLEGLLAWYRFDDEPGDGVLDSASGGRHGTCRPGETCPRLVQGPAGGAYEFDGADDHVRVRDDGAFGAGPFTVACWARVPSGHSAGLLSKPYGGGNENSWQLEIDAMGRVSFTGPIPDFASGVAIPYGQWIHLAGTFDGSTKRLYADGQLVLTRAATLRFDGQDVIIGGDLGNGTARTLVVPFRGALDDVRIYGRALAASEIARVIAAAAP